MQRVREIKWGPRIIDLDLIFYDDLVLEDDFVTVPHPRMEEREFVLRPLCEIAPNKVHPLLKKRVFRMLEELVLNRLVCFEECLKLYCPHFFNFI